MHIKMLLLHRELLVTIQSSTASPGPDVIYRIPEACPEFPRLSNSLLANMPISRDQIRTIHSRALSNASNISVTYPKLPRLVSTVEETYEKELDHGLV